LAERRAEVLFFRLKSSAIAKRGAAADCVAYQILQKWL